MADTADMILPMPREMSAASKEGVESINRRIDVLDAAQSSFRRARSCDTIPGKLVNGGFVGRMGRPERKGEALQAMTGAER